MNSVKFYQEKISLPTYPIASEDREPPLLPEFTPRGATIYPYTTQEVLSDKSVIHEYDAVYLENDFIKLTFLPELNGRLYSAFDKINGNELFYANPVIKTGLFAVRGAWAAVGVEFNFPNSHTSTTLDTVNCKTKEYDDGSASVIVGEIDDSSRMGWSVECKLHPDSSAIEMEIKLNNSTDLPQRYYYWTNAACSAYDETEFIFPKSTRKLLTHPPMDASRLARIDYPVHDGVNINFFKNIKQQFPVFVENMDEDFFGLYHHHLDYGVVHVADHSLVRGRKLWTFGTARDGRIFIDQLSDKGADYCELQTGPFSLQSDYRMLQPGRMHIQTEYWLPVANTNGFNLACREFAAKIVAEDEQIEIKLCATVKLENAVVKVLSRDNEIITQNFYAKPCQAIKLQLSITEFDSIIFLNADGEQLAVFTPLSIHDSLCDNNEPKIFNQPALQGKYLEEQDAVNKAITVYEKYSANDPVCMLAAARLAFNQGCFSKAEQYLLEVMRVDHNNGEGLILQGLLYYRNKNLVLAERAFSRAADDNRFRDRALYYLAYCAVSVLNYRRALNIFDEMSRYGVPDVRAQRLKVYCLQQSNMDYVGAKILAENIFPISSTMEEIGELIGLRHYAAALKLLKQSDKKNDASFLYYLAWLNHMIGNETAALDYLSKVAKTPWNERFAFRLEMEAMLRYALDIRHDDYTASYQLGCLLASKKRWEEAIPFWEAISAGIYLSDSQRNLALYYWKVKGDIESATQYFQLSTFANDTSSRTLLEAEIFFEEIGDLQTRLKLFENNLSVKSDSRLQLAWVKILLDSKCPEKAFDLLKTGNFRLCEGKMLSRRLYENVCAVLAENAVLNKDYEAAVSFYLKATEYPENIGLGKPCGNKEAKWYYLAGITSLKLGDKKQAEKCFSKGAEKGDWIDIKFFPIKQLIWEASWENIDVAYWTNIFFRSRCSQKAGLKVQAEALMQRFSEYMQSQEKHGRQSITGYKELTSLNINF